MLGAYNGAKQKNPVASLLVAFGDDTPAPDTVAVLEEILIEYITDVVRVSPLHSYV